MIYGFGPENVGLIFPMIASHLKTGLSDQQNHWVQWGLANIFRHTHIPSSSEGPYQTLQPIRGYPAW